MIFQLFSVEISRVFELDFRQVVGMADSKLSPVVWAADSCGDCLMAGSSQGIVFGSMGVAGLLALLAAADLAAAVPFGGQTTFDVLFILAAALVIYMGIDCLKDAK
jgi:hypothetical protein